MSSAAKKVLDDALMLPASEREALVEALNESLEHGSAQLSQEWLSLIERRIASVEAGETKLVAGSEVEARVRERLRER